MDVEKEGPTTGKIMGELVVIEHIEDIYNVSISTLVLKNMTNLLAILGEVNGDCNDQCFNAYEIPIMQLSRGNEVLTNSSDNDDDVEQRHENALERNLAPFNLLKDPTIGDGDYDFRTIVRQIRKTVEWSDP